MIRRTLILLATISLLAGCPSEETTTETTTTETTTETASSPAASPTAESEAAAVPADWKKIESKEHGIQFAHPPSFKVIQDGLKPGSKEPMYIAGDEHMTMAIIAMPNDKALTSQAISDMVFNTMTSELKLTDVKKEAPVDQKDTGGFASWTDIDGTATFQGKPHTITAGGGKAPDKAKSSVGLFVIYPEGEKGDDVFAQVYGSLVTME